MWTGPPGCRNFCPTPGLQYLLSTKQPAVSLALKIGVRYARGRGGEAQSGMTPYSPSSTPPPTLGTQKYGPRCQHGQHHLVEVGSARSRPGHHPLPQQASTQQPIRHLPFLGKEECRVHSSTSWPAPSDVTQALTDTNTLEAPPSGKEPGILRHVRGLHCKTAAPLLHTGNAPSRVQGGRGCGGCGGFGELPDRPQICGKISIY